MGGYPEEDLPEILRILRESIKTLWQGLIK